MTASGLVSERCTSLLLTSFMRFRWRFFRVCGLVSRSAIRSVIFALDLLRRRCKIASSNRQLASPLCRADDGTDAVCSIGEAL